MIAINKILFRESNKFTRPDVFGPFQGTSSGECPARATSTLILDGCDSTEGNPVNIVGKLQVFLQETCHVGSFLVRDGELLGFRDNLGTVLAK
jgi:hypothetical protein